MVTIMSENEEILIMTLRSLCSIYESYENGESDDDMSQIKIQECMQHLRKKAKLLLDEARDNKYKLPIDLERCVIEIINKED